MDETIAEARAEYFRANGLGDGGYTDAWVRFRVGPFPIAFPNTAGRRRAVPFHDVHHVLTGYGTDLAGEAEIGAWELASGCLGVPAAAVLNLLAMYGGLFVAPRAVYRAFVRGRHSRNLYGGTLDERLLGGSVDSVRERLELDRSPPGASGRDRVAFALCTGAALTAGIGPAAVAIGLLVSWLRA